MSFIQFIITIILSRKLGPDTYGSVALILIFVVIANVVVDSGLSTSLIQKKESDSLDYSTVFWANFFVALLLYFLFYFLSPFITNYFNQPQLLTPLRVLSISLIFYAANSVQRAYAVKRMWFRKLFYCNLFSIFISGSIGVFLVYCDWGLWSLILQILLNIVFICFFMFLIIRWRPSMCFSLNRFCSLFDYGWKILLTNLIINIFVRIRGLIIGRKYAPSTLAFYTRGEQFPSLISDNIFGSIQTVLFPAFSEIQDNRENVRLMMLRSIHLSCFFIFPAMIGLVVCAKPVVLLLLGNEWLQCVPYIQILCLSNFFYPITVPNNQATMALGYSNITLRQEIIRKVCDILILVVSFRLGSLAIAWGVVLYNFVCLFINLYPNITILQIGFLQQIRGVIPTFITSLLMGFSIMWFLYLPVHPLYQILFMVVLGIVLYFFLNKLIHNESYNYIIGILKERFFNK